MMLHCCIIIIIIIIRIPQRQPAALFTVMQMKKEAELNPDHANEDVSVLNEEDDGAHDAEVTRLCSSRGEELNMQQRLKQPQLHINTRLPITSVRYQIKLFNL